MDKKTIKQIQTALERRLNGLTDRALTQKGWHKRADLLARIEELEAVIKLIGRLSK